MIKFLVFSVLVLSVSAASGTTTGNRKIKESACVKVETANVVSTLATAGKCLSVPTAAGATTACCYAQWAAAPKIPHKTQASGAADQDISAGGDVFGATNGGFKTDAVCFAAGGDATFLSPTNGRNEAKNLWIDMTDLCGAAGDTPAISTDKFYNYWYDDGTNADGLDVGTNVAYDTADAATDSARNGIIFAAKATTCKCGTSLIPSDKCAALAGTDLNTKCMTTDDSQTTAKKCCLVTFDAVPTTAKATPAKIVAGAKGGLVSSDTTPKYYACYQNKADGYFRFKTGDGTITSKEAAVKWEAFCGTGKVTTEVNAAYVYDVDVVVDSATTTSGLIGKAATC